MQREQKNKATMNTVDSYQHTIVILPHSDMRLLSAMSKHMGWQIRKTKRNEVEKEAGAENDISPYLSRKINKARKEHREGKTLSFNTAVDAQKWMDEL